MFPRLSLGFLSPAKFVETKRGLPYGQHVALSNQPRSINTATTTRSWLAWRGHPTNSFRQWQHGRPKVRHETRAFRGPAT